MSEKLSRLAAMTDRVKGEWEVQHQQNIIYPRSVHLKESIIHRRYKVNIVSTVCKYISILVHISMYFHFLIFLLLNCVFQAVQWVNTIIDQAHAPAEARDTTIQVLDGFIQKCVLDQNPFLSNAKYISLAAAVSAIVATKVHDSSRSLSTASFPFFKAIDLVSFERYLLEKIQYDISINNNPTLFMLNMLEAWEEGQQFHEALLREASALLSLFWLSIESITYAPFTIATSALLLSFSKLGVDPSSWLKTLPESCIPRSSPLLPLCFDVDRCLETFVKSGSASMSSLQINISIIDEIKDRKDASPSTISDLPKSPTVLPPAVSDFVVTAATDNHFVPIKNLAQGQESQSNSIFSQVG